MAGSAAGCEPGKVHPVSSSVFRKRGTLARLLRHGGVGSGLQQDDAVGAVSVSPAAALLAGISITAASESLLNVASALVMVCGKQGVERFATCFANVQRPYAPGNTAD